MERGSGLPCPKAQRVMDKKRRRDSGTCPKMKRLMVIERNKVITT
jgi:hypothetical protein